MHGTTVKIRDHMLVLSNSAGLICISLCQIQMTDLSNEMLSMNHGKFKFKIILKFAAATEVTKRITKSVLRVVKSRRMRWAGHVARMGDDRGVHRVLVGKPEGKRPLGRPRRRWEYNIQMGLQKVGGGVGTGWSWLRIGIGGGHLWVR